MSKTIIAPLVGFLIILVKMIFKVEIPNDVAAQITDVVVTAGSLAVVLVGIFKNHRKIVDNSTNK